MSEPILKIRKCPICGGESEAHFMYYGSVVEGANPYFYVTCLTCGLRGKEFMGASGYVPHCKELNKNAETAAIEYWNNRVSVDKIERIVRDAIVDYNEMFPSAPNSDAEEELRQRARVAQEWLADNGFKEEPFYYFEKKEEV